MFCLLLGLCFYSIYQYFIIIIVWFIYQVELVIKNLPTNVGRLWALSRIPGWGTSPGGGNGNPLQYSCLKSSMDRGAWRARVHGAKKSWTRQHTHYLPLHITVYSQHLAQQPMCVQLNT